MTKRWHSYKKKPKYLLTACGCGKIMQTVYKKHPQDDWLGPWDMVKRCLRCEPVKEGEELWLGGRGISYKCSRLKIKEASEEQDNEREIKQ